MKTHFIRMLVMVTVALVMIPALVGAQGCVTARMESPLPGGGTILDDGKSWDLSFGWRYFKSDRHYVGTEYQKHRDEEGSQVINWVNQADINLRYNLNARSSISVNAPYLMMERSNPIRDPDDRSKVLDRARTHANGLGDVTVTARRWMLDPHKHMKGNFSLGAGVKFPTGQSSVVDSTRRLNSEGEFETVVRPVDQSIQPGDGAFGFILDFQGFRSLSDRVTFYATGAYLFVPRETSYLASGSSRYWSANDNYAARLGFTLAASDKLTLGLGARLDGVPSEDLFGGNEGRRRPGYAWAVDPSLTLRLGKDRQTTLNMSVPVAFYRNRTMNVDDKRKAVPIPGDAAFANYNLTFGISHHFK